MLKPDPIKPTAGDWGFACDSYGKVQHSKKACVYTVIKGDGGQRLVNIAQRVESWDDARLMSASKELYMALLSMNEVQDGGYCICPRNNGQRPDADHATSCADARKAIRKVQYGNYKGGFDQNEMVEVLPA